MVMKLYATIESTAETQKIYVEGNNYYVFSCGNDSMSTHYGNPDQYIKNVLNRAAQLHEKVVIKR